MTDSLDLNILNEILDRAADRRGWVRVTFQKICRNCGSTYDSEPQIMRENSLGFLDATIDSPPDGEPLRSRTVPSHFVRCAKCSGARPLADDIKRVLDSSSTDRQLAQRLEALLGDFKRKSAREAS